MKPAEGLWCVSLRPVNKPQSQPLTLLFPERSEAEKFKWSAWVPTTNNGQKSQDKDLTGSKPSSLPRDPLLGPLGFPIKVNFHSCCYYKTTYIIVGLYVKEQYPGVRSQADQTVPFSTEPLEPGLHTHLIHLKKSNFVISCSAQIKRSRCFPFSVTMMMRSYGISPTCLIFWLRH